MRRRTIAEEVAQGHEALPWSGKTPSWARRAAHHCGRIARAHADPGSDATHHDMLVAIMREYENRRGSR